MSTPLPLIQTPQGTKPQLTLLFEADFKDGTTYHQGSDDKSLDPQGSSAFYDINKRKEDLLRFRLVGNGHIYEVDLVDGHFDIDGVPFEIHEQNLIPKDLRLVYFRDTKVQATLGMNQEIKTTNHFVNRYFIGWQCTINDKNHQYTLAVKGG
jgi:hypothetical protein